MADYQHVLPVQADIARRKEKCAEIKGPLEREDLGAMDDENLMMLVPPIFAPKDVPEHLVLKPTITLSSKKKQEGVVQHRWEMEIEPCLAIDFNIKEIPKKVEWEKYIPREYDQWNWQMVVSNLFDERPIWPKSSIYERLCNEGLKFGDHMLKRLLFRSAYYFGSGPFHRFWIRKGYDPRKDPESRIYQRIDFRVPPSLRGYCDASSGKTLKWEDLCAFRVFPIKCQTYLQLSELADDYIQKEIRKPPSQTICSSSSGWFTTNTLDTLRLRIAMRFISIYPQEGAASLLKSVSERFEKSKKTRFLSNLKPGEETDTQVDQDLTGDEDKVDNVDDYEDEENEIEDEDGDGDEEMDIDDTPFLDMEDADFTLESDSYFSTENVSRNYLQELFESFPSTRASDLHEDDGGEYQIYEQDSDDDY